MLTPEFEILQDELSITIIIKARLAKIAETEIFIDGDEFKFSSHPYFLRLTLPGRIVENGSETAKYDVDQGRFVINVPKETPSEHFQGLDMLTKLLAPKKYPGTKAPMIEVIDGDPDDNLSDEEEFDWQIEQTPIGGDDVTVGHFNYGFGNLRSDGLSSRVLAEYSEALDLREPEMTSPTERRRLRIEDENQHFEPEHYLADLFEDDCIEECLSYLPPWREEYRIMKEGSDPSKFIEFSDSQKGRLLSLPRKEYLISGDALSALYLGLIDLVYAYAYNARTTGGESGVESGWTVRKLSSTLSWFEQFSSVKPVVVASMRRSLCYPLYRHWRLAQKVLKDTKYIFRLGKKRILQCLLEIHDLLRDRDPFFVLNDLYVDDYCVWIQSASDRKLACLSKTLDEVKVEKSDLDFELEELEEAAELAIESDDNDSESDETETDSDSETESDSESELEAENIGRQLDGLTLTVAVDSVTSDNEVKTTLIEEVDNDDVTSACETNTVIE